MNIVYLYGPPGVGKLTVATELAALTGYRVLHNHLTVDLALAVYDFGASEFNAYVKALRMDLLRRACAADIPGAIVTFVYAQGSDDDYVRDTLDVARVGGAQVLFAQLTCNPDALRERMMSESRKAHRKLRNVDVLDRLMREHNLFGPVPFEPNFSLDTTVLSPDVVAGRIAGHFGLLANSSTG